MRPFGLLLDHPVYWALNRRNVTRALAVGLFIGCMPLPLHLLIAALVALPLRLNVPAAMAGTLISNPLTAAPLYYCAYIIGCQLLDVTARPVAFEMSWSWFTTTLVPVWKPLLLGSFVLGLATALIGYLLLGALWHLSLVIRYHRRKEGGAAKESAKAKK